jgi:hypothetical protein
MPGIQTVYQLGSTCCHNPELEQERKDKDLISYSTAAHRDVEAICKQVILPLHTCDIDMLTHPSDTRK